MVSLSAIFSYRGCPLWVVCSLTISEMELPLIFRRDGWKLVEAGGIEPLTS
jgi:hypothetical protein